MPKVKATLNGSSITKLKRFYKELAKKNTNIVTDDFKDYYTKLITRDAKSLKDCTEKSVVDNYITYGYEFLKECPEYTDNVENNIIKSVRKALLREYTTIDSDDIIDIYFNEVKKEYILHPQSDSDDLEFLPENRDIFIKNNLKLVVSCAKRYQNLGIPFEDLIQIGNVGLLTAFDKFDTSRSCLRQSIINDINNFERDIFTMQEAEHIITKNFEYDKDLNKSVNKLPEEGFASRQDFIDWVRKNIKTAVFASVAFQWIRAYILQELDKYSNIIRFPKSAKDEGNTSIIRLDSINPYTEDNYCDNELSEITDEEFAREDDYMTNNERMELYRETINNALIGLSAMDKRIIKKKYGIEFPYALNNQEIAENEGLTATEVKNSITRTLKHIAANIPESSKDIIIEMMS